MAEPRDKANLKRTTKACANSMLKSINKTVQDVEALIQDEMASAQHAWTDGGRERAYRAIRKRLGLMEQGLASTLEKLAKTAAKSGNEEAIRQVGDGAVTAFSEEHLAEYVSRINPSNAPSLAAVYTKSMEASVVTALRQTAISVYTRAAASGMTMNEQARAFQAEWSLRVRDANPYRFIDKSGRAWENARYIQMLARTTAQRVETAAFCDSMLSDGFPLARISNDSGNDCGVCAEWEGRLIDLTPGHKLGSGTYTLQEAREAGLFHPNCTHRLEYVSVLEIPDAIWAKVKDKIGKPGAWKDNPSVTEPNFPMKGDRIKHGREVEKAAKKRAEDDDHEIVRQQLEEKGVTLDKSLYDIDPKLLNVNAKRLNELLDKYPSVQAYVKKYGIDFEAGRFKDENTFAGVKTPPIDRRMTLKLSLNHYSEYSKHVAKEEYLSKIGYSMPCKKENAPIFTITHEFGHVIQNVLEKQYMDSHKDEFERVRKKSLEIGLKNPSKGKKILDDYCGTIRAQHAKDIRGIINELNPKITRQKFAEASSSYSTESDAEFFAEAFANAECGKPNIIGNAIKIFLERNLK